MGRELGKIEKPAADDYRKGRKLFFVPLIYSSKEAPDGYLEKFDRYWQQAKESVNDLELKLGPVDRIYHEFISAPGEEGLKVLEQLNKKSHQMVLDEIQKGARLEAAEDDDLLTEFMDLSRCLGIGLQSQKLQDKLYQYYVEAGKKRSDFIANHIDETLRAEEIGILFIKEKNQVQVPSGIEVFYVAPPALDEINRWLRDSETNLPKKRRRKTVKKESDR